MKLKIWPGRRRVLILLGILMMLCVLIAGGVSYVLVRAPRLFPAFPVPVQSNLRTHAGYRTVETTAEDGIRLAGYVITASGPKGTVLMVHGWLAEKHLLENYADAFLAMGWQVAAFDLRAHGESGGDRATLGVKEVGDIRREVEYLRREGLAPGPLVLFGISMGGALVLQSAGSIPDLAGVIAEAPFNRLDATCYHYFRLSFPMMPRYPVGWLAARFTEWQIGGRMRDHSAVAALADYATGPVFICHCEADPLVPVTNSEEIAAACGNVEFWRVPGGAHFSIEDAHPEEWRRRVSAFLDKVLDARP